jgi:hypothetical protein
MVGKPARGRSSIARVEGRGFAHPTHFGARRDALASLAFPPYAIAVAIDRTRRPSQGGKPASSAQRTEASDSGASASTPGG